MKINRNNFKNTKFSAKKNKENMNLLKKNCNKNNKNTKKINNNMKWIIITGNKNNKSILISYFN